MEDYKVCGYSEVGKSHKDKGVACQDSYFYKQGDGFIAAAVADGLSSSKHSDIASKMAATNSVEYCVENIKQDDKPDAILAVIKESFADSLFKIKRKAENAPNDYDTTLTLVVFIHGAVFYGQIGDSGMVALCADGKFERVTESQNGEGIGKDRPVYPLAAKERWVFNEYPQKAKALFLATDGVLKRIEPPLLEKQQYKLNHRHLTYVWNNIDKIPMDGSGDLDSWIKDEVVNMPPNEVDFDDKTLVVVSSTKVELHPQTKEYYNYPAEEFWKKINNEYKKSLYTSEPPPSKTESAKQTKTENGNLPLNHKSAQTSKNERPTNEKEDEEADLMFWRLLVIMLSIVVIALFAMIFIFRPAPFFQDKTRYYTPIYKVGLP